MPRRAHQTTKAMVEESTATEAGVVQLADTKGEFLTLPAELLEEIVVHLAHLGCPTSISSLARTCRALRKLIYAPQDKFLWRRIFLAVFDDPRNLNTDNTEREFGWASEYQSRIQAFLFVKHHAQPELMSSRKRTLRSSAKKSSTHAQTTTSPETSPEIVDFTSILQTILSILDTAHTVIPATAAPTPGQPWENPALSNLPTRQASTRAPEHPPCLESSSLESLPQISLSKPNDSSHIVAESKNITFLKDLFSMGVLPDLVNHLTNTVSSDRGTPWQSTPAAQCLNRLVATMGIFPLLATPRPATSSKEYLASTHDDARQQAKAKGEEHTLFRSAAYSNNIASINVETFRDIRYASQKKVYDLSYLSHRRAWGPFLRVPRPADGGGRVVDSDDDEDDEDFVPTGGAAPESDDGSAASEEDGEFIPLQAQVPRGLKPVPPPEDLRADWEHLAAIRVVVQARMVEIIPSMFGSVNLISTPELDEIGNTLLGWENLRAGVWSVKKVDVDDAGWDEQGRSGGSKAADGPSGSSGNMLKTPSDPPPEWDWAGVQGVWRRAVCWLDYHDLILQNYNNFSHPHGYHSIEEATLTVPLTLRVTGFSPSTIPEYKNFPTIHFDTKRFPTIHVEGTMGGAEWGFLDEQQDVRRVKGTVSVCGDGSVRWSMVSSIRGMQNEWEWASEGVQIGSAAQGPVGVRSGCGVLGLWTGWEHEEEDPIGAWWQWRVA